jgi:hypothetical protein
MQIVPASIRTELINIALSQLKSVEFDILNQFDKLLEPFAAKDHNRIPLWVSLMQCILIYRDVYRATTLEFKRHVTTSQHFNDGNSNECKLTWVWNFGAIIS